MTVPAITGTVTDTVVISNGSVNSITPPDDQFMFMVYAPDNYTPTFTGLSFDDLNITLHTRPGYTLYLGYYLSTLADLEMTWAGTGGANSAEIIAVGTDTAFNFFRHSEALWRYNQDPLPFPTGVSAGNTGNLVAHAVWVPFNGINTLTDVDPPTNPPALVTDHLGFVANPSYSNELPVVVDGIDALTEASFTWLGAPIEVYFAVSFTFIFSETAQPDGFERIPGFQYTHRWAQVAEAFNKGQTIAALEVLERRDQELEYEIKTGNCSPFEYTNRWPAIWAAQGDRRVELLEAHDRELELWFKQGCGSFEYTARYAQIPDFVGEMFTPTAVRVLEDRDYEVEQRLSNCSCGGPV